jgi:ribosomal protein S18 acetylase RimI-like enzyme
MAARENGDVPGLEDVQVRRLQDVDDQVVADLQALIVQVSPSAPPLNCDRVRSVIDDRSTTVFVAELRGRIVGTASLVTGKTLSEEKGYVEDVVVDTGVRRNGVGGALMNAILDHARRIGLRHVNLTSRPEREAANAFYVALGFEQRDTNVYRYEIRRTN